MTVKTRNRRDENYQLRSVVKLGNPTQSQGGNGSVTQIGTIKRVTEREDVEPIVIPEKDPNIKEPEKEPAFVPEKEPEKVPA